MVDNKEKWGTKTSKNSNNISDSASESAAPNIEKKIDVINEQALQCHCLLVKRTWAKVEKRELLRQNLKVDI